MTILRNREVPSSAQPKTRLLNHSDDLQPSTPARTQESVVHRSPVNGAPPPDKGGSDGITDASSRRRSARLAHQRGGEGLSDDKEVSVSVCGKRKSNDSVGERVLSLRSGKRVAMVVGKSDGLETESRKLDFESELDVHGGEDSKQASRSQRKSPLGDFSEADNVSNNAEIDRDYGVFLIASEREIGETVEMVESDADDMLLENSSEVVLLQNESKDKGKGVVEDSDEDNDSDEKPSSSVVGRKYTWEEKGKAIQVENVSFSPIKIEIEQAGVEDMVEVDNLINNDNPPDTFVAELPAPVNVEQNQNHNGNDIGNASRNNRFLDFARRHASRFAHFDGQTEDEEDLSDKEVDQDVEDWPGPFSTAMKIMKERADNEFVGIGTHASNEESSLKVTWTPKSNSNFIPRKTPPTLQELSFRVLAKNADAITSLDYIPDPVRSKLSELVCDSRRMNLHFLDLLVRGSPTEICVPDCSWLTEEQFIECFKSCDTSGLTVLQLDLAGQCMPDYVLSITLARSPNNLPMLSSLSIKAAYRLSDVGLRALVSVAPAIRSINLSQCSLLTSSSINMLADSLGLVLRELYINECQNIDMKLMLPALKKFENLEVLSLGDLPSVRDQSLRELVGSRGQTLKQLILTNAVRLTDPSVKAISENCPNLTVLDLANVCKLTDSALGYLANGCQSLEKLIFCRNSFSDEAVAAFVQTASGSLKELSLNNVNKVGNNTALALGKYAKQLLILDVSWCRDIPNDSLGYIVDNCASLKLFKVFGCTQITDVFVRGHSNPNVKIIGLKMDPFLDNLTKEHHFP